MSWSPAVPSGVIFDCKIYASTLGQMNVCDFQSLKKINLKTQQSCMPCIHILQMEIVLVFR